MAVSHKTPVQGYNIHKELSHSFNNLVPNRSYNRNLPSCFCHYITRDHLSPFDDATIVRLRRSIESRPIFCRRIETINDPMISKGQALAMWAHYLHNAKPVIVVE